VGGGEGGGEKEEGEGSIIITSLFSSFSSISGRGGTKGSGGSGGGGTKAVTSALRKRRICSGQSEPNSFDSNQGGR
jgi:hypothetical protein